MALRWPDGVRSGIAECGIKPQGPDLGLLVFDEPASWAGAFTQNAAAAAPVIWSRSRLGTAVKALVVNSGNANACTGTAGSAAVARTTELTASLVAAQREQVLVASTGPIGITLPVEQVCSGITGAHASLDTDVEPFASSILTTDSCPKLATERAGDGMTIGVAKGAAMIAPNMATMLAFIVTDVWAPLGQLQES
jgi:glutamate N-acetyltransferase/amino-acid N-acetyltransferase